MASIIKSDIGRLKAKGSARSGAEHWKLQRVTAIANIPLILWFIVSAASLSGADYATARAWLAGPFNTTMMILLVVSAFWHARLGLQVVVEDYLHDEGVKIFTLLGITLLIVALAVSCLVAILKVSLGS